MMDPSSVPIPPKVLPETILAAGQVAASLAEAIKALANAKMEKPALELTAHLADLSRSIRWLLKEDREKFAEMNNATVPMGSNGTEKFRSKAYIKPSS